MRRASWTAVLAWVCLACAPKPAGPAQPDTDTDASASPPPATSGPRMPAGGEYVAISDARYGQLDSVVGAPSVGDQAPDFELPNHLGTTTRLSELLAAGSGPVVLMFYRGFW